MLYEKLNQTMQRMVDEYARQLRPLAWNRRSDLDEHPEMREVVERELGEPFSGMTRRLYG